MAEAADRSPWGAGLRSSARSSSAVARWSVCWCGDGFALDGVVFAGAGCSWRRGCARARVRFFLRLRLRRAGCRKQQHGSMATATNHLAITLLLRSWYLPTAIDTLTNVPFGSAACSGCRQLSKSFEEYSWSRLNQYFHHCRIVPGSLALPLATGQARRATRRHPCSLQT